MWVIGEDEQDALEGSQLLAQNLLDSGTGSVSLTPTSTPPSGAKAIEAISAGLMITGMGVGALVRLVRAWLQTQSTRSVVLETDGERLELSALSSNLQDKIVSEWLSRNEANGVDG
jgi:hypothetical protein